MINFMSLRTRRRAALLLGTVLAASAAHAQAPTVSAAWRDGSACYEVFVRSFQDSDGDGIGDLKGLIGRLDYINDGNARSARSLGARCIWLMPIMESPSYHGYDVRDYYRVAKALGTNDDFKSLVAAAHKRGIAVIVDMVLNHASEQWRPFQDALARPDSPYRSWFRFAPQRGPNNRWGNNNWHKSPLRDEYYYGFFWKGMPDLNYEQPGALDEMKKVAAFWLNEMGADGFRLDAVKYLVEDGAVVEDTPGTHRVLREYAEFVRRTKTGAFTIGEVFDSTGVLLSYYPDQLDAYFAFEVADSLIAGVRRSDGRGILAPVVRLQRSVPPERVGLFLRNHDQPRTRTELGGDWGKTRVAAFLQLTLPGLPFIYYGEEVGMTGGKPDELIRRPMSWGPREAHAGFTTGTPWHSLAPDSAATGVEAQTADTASLLNWYRQLMQWRAQHPVLARGIVTPLVMRDSTLVAWVTRDGDDAALVIANLGLGPAVDVAVPGLLAPEFPTYRIRVGEIFPATATWTTQNARTTDASFRVPLIPPTSGVVISLRRP